MFADLEPNELQRLGIRTGHSAFETLSTAGGQGTMLAEPFGTPEIEDEEDEWGLFGPQADGRRRYDDDEDEAEDDVGDDFDDEEEDLDDDLDEEFDDDFDEDDDLDDDLEEEEDDEM